MKLYAGTIEQFRADASDRGEAARRVHDPDRAPAGTVRGCWQNSLMALSMLLEQPELNDHGVIGEDQLGTTTHRLDAMLTGELKQWSDL